MNAAPTSKGAGKAVAVHLQFSLKTLMLTTLFLAFCLGAFHVAIFLGVAFLLLSVPALIRTVRVGRRAMSEGRPLGMFAQIVVFLRSLQLVAWMVFALLAALLCGGLSAALVVTVAAARVIVFVADYLRRGGYRVDGLRRLLFRTAASCASVNLGLLRRFCAS